MSLPTEQKEIFLPGKQQQLLVQATEVYKPGPGQILVRIESTALNPVDWKVQETGYLVEKYPFFLGTDAAATVVALGEGVTQFQVGDKVFYQGYFTKSLCTFQQYGLVHAEIAAKIPSNISFDQAASVPLGFATAVIGLYHEPADRGGAGLVAPWSEGGTGKYAGKPIVIFGGSTSVSQYTIQLAKLSGFNPIITTVSPRNFDLVKSLGATHPLDRHLSPSAVPDAVKAITAEPVTIVYDAIAEGEIQQAAQATAAPGGTIVTVFRNAIPEEKRDSSKTVIFTLGTVHAPTNRKLGIELYSKITELFASGAIKPNRVEVVPGGLNAIQEQLNRLKNGEISGHKVHKFTKALVFIGYPRRRRQHEQRVPQFRLYIARRPRW
ncbi:zinc-containing alcohol dehydrogenase family protein, partial [Abortiporus biennis]